MKRNAAAPPTQLAKTSVIPTSLGEGESIRDLLDDATAFEQFDSGAYFDGHGFGFVRLQQLATEHLMGAR